jgi:hypothetical protein
MDLTRLDALRRLVALLTSAVDVGFLSKKVVVAEQGVTAGQYVLKWV